MQNPSLQEKINLYCDLNEISNPESYYAVIPFVENAVYQHCIARNTNDFLIYWIWDLAHWRIDDETFFQIWDITSDRPLKQPRPHLDAVDMILKHPETNTLYVIDIAAKIAYEQVHWSRDNVTKKMWEKSSAIVAL
jgi:hypothetical protein